MKRISLFFAATLMLVFSMGIMSCEKEDPIVKNDPPQVSLVSGNSYVSSDATVEGNSNVTVKVKAVTGTGDLKLLTIYEDGSKMDLERFGDNFNSNPWLISDEVNKAGFEKEITFSTHDEGIKEYMFVLEDVNALKDTVRIALDIVIPETPLNYEKENVQVYNADGPAGYNGSLDLQTGEVKKTNGPTDTDVQDLGLNDNGDWAKQIKPENGASMYVVAEGVSYDDINTLEALLEAKDQATKQDVADVTVGSRFIFTTAEVNGESDIFIVICTKIEEVDSNKDYYVFNYKGYKF